MPLIIPSLTVGDMESTPTCTEVSPPYPQWLGNHCARILETQDCSPKRRVFVSDKAYGVLQNSTTRAPFVCDVEIVPLHDLIDCDVEDLPRKANVRRDILSQGREDLCAPETLLYLARDHYDIIDHIAPVLYCAMNPVPYNREGHFILVFRSDNVIDAVSSVMRKEDVRYSHWVFARNKRPIE